MYCSKIKTLIPNTKWCQNPIIQKQSLPPSYYEMSSSPFPHLVKWVLLGPRILALPSVLTLHTELLLTQLLMALKGKLKFIIRKTSTPLSPVKILFDFFHRISGLRVSENDYSFTGDNMVCDMTNLAAGWWHSWVSRDSGRCMLHLTSRHLVTTFDGESTILASAIEQC